MKLSVEGSYLNWLHLIKNNKLWQIEGQDFSNSLKNVSTQSFVAKTSCLGHNCRVEITACEYPGEMTMYPRWMLKPLLLNEPFNQGIL